MKSKIFNYRPIFLAFISFILGILVIHYAYSAWPIALALYMLFASLVIFYCIKHKRFAYLLLSFPFMIIGALGFFLEVKPFTKLKEYSAISVIQGEVINLKGGYYATITLDNVKINGEDIDGKVLVSYQGSVALTSDIVGCSIIFDSATIEKKEVTLGDENSYYNVYNKMKYFVKTYEIDSIKEIESPKHWLKDKIRTSLYQGLSNENAEFMFSAIFGDKALLSDDLYDTYRSSGVVHILAVSGLHVGLIVTCLAFLLDRTKCNKYVKLIITSLILLFYCYLCSWAVPVIRASIMTIVMLFSTISYRQYDSLSSISLAGIIILIFSPATIFSISFLTSFISVLGIMMLYTPTRNLLQKFKLNKKFSKAVATSFAVNFSIISIMAYFFNEVNFTGLIANIFILPVFSIIFCCVFVLAILSVFMPAVAYLLNFINPIIDIINLLASYFASSAFIKDSLTFSLFTSLAFVFAVFFASKFNVLKSHRKIIYLSAILVLLLGIMLIDRYVYLL